ncbi:cytochrome P450 [Trametes cingulata]|nr:cytochrome P450 [Trametes cingulata]
MARDYFSGEGLLVLLAIVVFLLVLGCSHNPTRAQFPPGPESIPLLGSVHKLPLEFQEKRFFRWGKQYGDVIYLRLFRTPTIVLNSFQAATDLLTKRSAKYSDRPRMVLLAELMGHESSLPPMPYGERFRKHRRWMHEAIGTKEKLESYRTIQLREAHNLVRNLLNTPGRFLEHLHLYVGATMLEITYGRRITSLEDELVAVADRAIEGVNNAGTPGSMIVDFFPVLKGLPEWMPGAGFKRSALEVRRYVQAWKDTGYAQVRAAMSSGDAPACVTATLLEEVGGRPSPDEAEDIKGLGCSVYGAGIETTRGALATFFLAMTRHPDVLHKAQCEVDKAVGKERLPDFGDRRSLPYIDAMLEELYRWNPPLPLAIPHRAMADDEYRGYTIPRGCMMMPNIWAMSRDGDWYNDPEEFRPERHLETFRGNSPPPSEYVFGFGRRVCPGQAFADATLWLAIATIVAAFDIGIPVDSEGDEHMPPPAFQPGFTSQPKPFSCRITSRCRAPATDVAK